MLLYPSMSDLSHSKPRGPCSLRATICASSPRINPGNSALSASIVNGSLRIAQVLCARLQRSFLVALEMLIDRHVDLGGA